MSSNERRLQTRGVQWLKSALPNVMVVAVPNEDPIAARTEDEVKTKIIRIQLLKSMGMYPGAADMFLFWNDGVLQVRALETKDKAPQSRNQKKFQAHWEKIGGIYHIWRTLPELYDLCVSWGLKPVVAPPGWVPATRKQMQANMYHQIMMDLSRPDNQS